MVKLTPLAVVSIVVIGVLGLVCLSLDSKLKKKDTWLFLAEASANHSTKSEVEAKFGRSSYHSIGDNGLDVCRYPWSIDFADRWWIEVYYDKSGRVVGASAEGKQFGPESIFR